MNEEQIKALIAESLQSAGFLTKSEFNSTAAMIRGLKESMESIKTSNPLDALVTAGLIERAEDGSIKPKSQQTKKESVPEWQAQLDEMRKQMEAKDKQIAAEKQQREQLELKSAVVAALEKAGAVNPERDHVHVLNLVKRGEDGKFFVGKTNEFGAEDKLALEAAFGDFLKSNPELAKAQTKPGSGTPNGTQSKGYSANPDINALAQMTPEQYFATRSSQK